MTFFRKLDILPLPKLYSFSIQGFMHKYEQNVLPNIFDDMFIRNRDILRYNTRQSNYFHQPKARTDFMTRTLQHKAVTISNYFRTIIDYNSSMKTFKTILKKHLMSSDRID
jgi:hypothetical protein